MKVTIYKCDVCGKTLSDESVSPKIEIPHIHTYNKGIKLARPIKTVWIEENINHSILKTSHIKEYQYCIDCFLKTIQGVKNANDKV